MNLKLKYFTVQEAEALLPSIRTIMSAAFEHKRNIEIKIETWRKKKETINEAEEAVFRGQVDYMASELEKKLSEITALGGVPKDLESGLVDFPARVDGKEGFLCWKVGETRVNHWHGLTEGFQGRKELR